MSRVKRIYLVNRDLQLRYARLGVLVGAISTLLTLLLVLYPLFQLQIVRFPNFLPAPFLAGIGAAALINFGTVAFLGILVSHRIAGPMFSMVRQLRALQDGKLHSHVKIRASDDLKYLVRHFNDMVDTLLATNRKDVGRVDAVLTLLSTADVDAAQQALRELRDEMTQRAVPPPAPEKDKPAAEGAPA